MNYSRLQYTVILARMSHWKWRETKQQPSRARSGHQISCCSVSLHFLCDILAMITVELDDGVFQPIISLLTQPLRGEKVPKLTCVQMLLCENEVWTATHPPYFRRPSP